MANYQSAIPYIQKAEGGLSRATTDTASRNPSPYTYKGQKGWHTNRGITWETFVGMAPKSGYSVTEDNFIRMPDSVWLSIYRKGYWEPMYGDKYDSQAIANAVVDFAWASGIGGATKALKKYLKTKGVDASGASSVADGFNSLVKRQGETKVFNDLIEERKRFFKSLNQKANEKGWLGRMETLRQQGMDMIKENPIKTVLITVGLALLAYYAYKKIKGK
jgi:lysozyme family protein